MRDKLSRNRLKELLDYDGDTGYFIWREDRGFIVTGKQRTGKSLNRWFRPSGLWDSNVYQSGGRVL